MKSGIRRAVPGDASRLTAIAMAGKAHWGYPKAWLSIWKDALTISPAYISENTVYAMENSGTIIGFYALIIGDGRAELDHLWLDPAFIGTGRGRELFERASKTADELGISSFEIEADPNAESFYIKMGAVRTGETVSDLDGKPRVLPLLTYTISESLPSSNESPATE